MIKSRTAPALIILLMLLQPWPARAQSVEDPVEAQRARLRAAMRPGCLRGQDSEEIVVCGTRDDERYRVPLVVEPGSIRSGSRAGGEQRAAMAANDARCTPVGRDQQCNGGIDMIGIGLTIARAVVKAIANGD